LADYLRCRSGDGVGQAFDSPASIFREHATLSGIAGQMGRDFDISGLADIDDQAYDDLAPVRWPVSATRNGGRFFDDGRFFTPDGRARMVPVTAKPMAAPLTEERPLRLNTGRIRDQWHTMTRTTRSPRLNQHLAEPFAEIHPVDATEAGITDANLVRVGTDHGQIIVRALVTDRVQPRSIFVPMHWTSAWASDGRVDAVVAPFIDPVSGQPELKGAAASMSVYRPAWYAFAVSTERPQVSDLPGVGYWAVAKTETGWRVELAGDITPICWESHARLLFGAGIDTDAVSVIDKATGLARVAISRSGHVLGAVFVDRDPVALARSHVTNNLDKLGPSDLLSGRPSTGVPDPGAIVCVCANVGVRTISQAVEKHGLTTIDAIGDTTGAGTNCGSCRPELKAFLQPDAPKVAAE